MDRPDERKPRVPDSRRHVERGSLERRRCPVRARRRRDSLKLYAIPAGLAMRDDERTEVTRHSNL